MTRVTLSTLPYYATVSKTKKSYNEKFSI